MMKGKDRKKKTVKKQNIVFDIGEQIWAYDTNFEKWRKAIVTASRKSDESIQNIDSNIEYYIHWKGFDRRLDCWISSEHVNTYSEPILDDEYENESFESEEHADVDLEYLKEHQQNTKFKTINYVKISKFLLSCWYFSPYPSEFQNINILYVCEFCLTFFKYEEEYKIHEKRCVSVCPPGNEIYRKDGLAIWELDGSLARVYCENLCYLSKLFLDHKTLRHPVSLFIFYVLTEIKENGYIIVGYFSKEKYSKNNLSCILILPHYQKKGYGKYLIHFSYALSKKENRRGTPERPFSDLGRISYWNYWTQEIINFLKTKESFKIEELADDLGFQTADIATTFKQNHLLWTDPNTQQKFLYLSKKHEQKLEKKLGKPANRIDFDILYWVSYDKLMGNFDYLIE